MEPNFTEHKVLTELLKKIFIRWRDEKEGRKSARNLKSSIADQQRVDEWRV